MANRKPDQAAKVEVAKSKFKVHLRSVSTSSAVIYRDNLPDIIDNREAAVRWLAEKGFKAEEIEIIGEKPANWDVVFPPPAAPEAIPIAEALEEVLSKLTNPIPPDPKEVVVPVETIPL
jgi:hypothetical protein